MIFTEDQNDFLFLLGRDSDDLLFDREQQDTLIDFISPQLVSEEVKEGTDNLGEETKNGWGEDWSLFLAEYPIREQEEISIDQVVENIIKLLIIKL